MKNKKIRLLKTDIVMHYCYDDKSDFVNHPIMATRLNRIVIDDDAIKNLDNPNMTFYLTICNKKKNRKGKRGK